MNQPIKPPNPLNRPGAVQRRVNPERYHKTPRKKNAHERLGELVDSLNWREHVEDPPKKQTIEELEAEIENANLHSDQQEDKKD